MNNMKAFSKIFGAAACLLVVPGLCLAEPIFADAVPAQEFEEKIPVEEVEPVVQKTCGTEFRLSAGAPIFFFDEEDDQIAGGAYLDVFHCDYPVNFRVGAEVLHMDLEQDSAAPFAEFPGKTVEASFVRVPLSVEYYREFSQGWYIATGPGLSIINTANDHSETGVGFHLNFRLGYEWSENWGVALNAGYLWAELDGDGAGDVVYDSAFLVPALSYRF